MSKTIFLEIFKAVDVETLEVDGIDSNDYPEFSDAYFSAGKTVDGRELSGYHLLLIEKQFPELLQQMAVENY